MKKNRNSMNFDSMVFIDFISRKPSISMRKMFSRKFCKKSFKIHCSWGGAVWQFNFLRYLIYMRWDIEQKPRFFLLSHIYIETRLSTIIAYYISHFNLFNAIKRMRFFNWIITLIYLLSSIFFPFMLATAFYCGCVYFSIGVYIDTDGVVSFWFVRIIRRL